MSVATVRVADGRILQVSASLKAVPAAIGASTVEMLIPNGTPWAASSNYQLGNVRAAGGAAYICCTAGESASDGDGPSGTGVEIADGTAVWNYYAPSPELDIGFDTHQVANAGTATAFFETFVATLEETQRTRTNDAAAYFALLFMWPAVFTWSGIPYQIDQASQIAISGLAQAAAANIANPGSVPLPSFWIAADNSRQTMTAAQFYAMASAIGNYVSGCREQFRKIKDAILAAGTIAAVQAIDVTAGYPAATA